MTIAPERPTIDRKQTPESRTVANLRAELKDPAKKEFWPEIREAIAYHVGETFIRDLAA